jgi:predicted enzyme related to lactoylglutathione lyase
MTNDDDIALGAPCWADLFTSDPDASRTFYGELFGWTSEAGGEEFGGYVTFALDGRQVAGAMRNDGSGPSGDVWSVYLAAADAAATVDAATVAGATVIVPAMPVGDLGSMAVVSDPGGAAIGVWQPGQHRGFQAVREPGAPAWFELHTRDYDKVVGFYESVFGWDTHVQADTPEFRYTTLGEGDAAAAGVMDATAGAGSLSEGEPAHWAIYFAVADADAAVARATELGATVLDAPMDTPYGRLARLSDPTGATFRLIAG